MMRKLAKISAAVLIAVLLINMVLFGMRKISITMFWAVIAVIGAVAYLGVLRER